MRILILTGAGPLTEGRTPLYTLNASDRPRKEMVASAVMTNGSPTYQGYISILSSGTLLGTYYNYGGTRTTSTSTSHSYHGVAAWFV